MTVSGNIFSGSASSVTITENGAGSVSPSIATASPFAFTYTPAAGDEGNIVTITVTTDNPLGAPCAAATATYTLTVNAIPAAPVPGTITQPTCTVAIGSLVLNGLPTGNWTINPGLITGSGASTTITGLSAGTYSYTVTNEAGCTSAASAEVVINAASGVTPGVSITSTTTSICVGGSVTFTATPVNGGTAPAYVWQVNGSTVAGQTAVAFTTTTLANNDQVRVIMTSNDPCASPATATSNAITMSASSVTPSVSITSTITSICAGSSVTFTATPVNGGTAPAYVWQVNGTTVAGQTAATFTTTTLANNDQVRVIMTSNDPCASPATATSNAITMSAGSVTPSVSIISTTTSICLGGSVTFTATPVNGGTAPAYVWQVNGTTVAGQTAATFTTNTLANNDQVRVIMTSDDPCAFPATAISNAITMSASSSITPSVSITSTITSICAGSSVTFTATPVNGGTAPAYVWQVNGTTVAGQTAVEFTTTTLANNDQIRVIMTSNDPCASPATATSNAITMSAGSVTPSVSITSTITSICAGSSVTFTATPVNGGTAPAYVWQVNGTTVAGQTAATFTTTTLANNDQVRVIMTSNDPCASPATATSNAITMSAGSVTPSVSIISTTTSICLGGSVTFTATPVNGGTAPSYVWQVNGSAVAGQTAATFTTNTLANNDQVTVIMTSNDPCASPASATSNAITMYAGSVTPSVSITTATTSICLGSSVTFTATPVNGGTAPAYVWQVNGSAVPGQTAATFSTTTLKDNDEVSVVMTSNDPCATTATALSNTIIVIANSYTVELSDFNSFNISCCGKSDGYIKINPRQELAPFIFNWTGPEGFTSSLEDISGLKAGHYTMSITDRSGCIVTQEFDLTEPGVLGMNVALSVSMDGSYNINCAGDKTGSITVSAFNNVGEVNYLWEDGYSENARTNLSAGLYKIIVSDLNSCNAEFLAELTEPKKLNVGFVVTPTFCPDMPEGEITLNVTGGIEGGGYTYLVR